MTERIVVDGHVAAGLVFDLVDGNRAEVYRLDPGSDPILNFGPVTKRTAARFAVGHPNECSSVFRVWANRGKLDVYASIRTWKDLAKFSFHQSGRFIFHLASVDHAGADWVERPDPDNRRIDAWDRPEPFVPGWTHLITFIVPTEDVVPYEGVGWEDHDKVRWITKPARADTVTEIRIALGEQHMPLVDTGAADYFLDAGIVDGFVLADGRLALITTHVTVLDPVRREWLDGLRRHARQGVPEGFELSGTETRAPRIAHHTEQSDGRHVLWDITPYGSAVDLPRGQQWMSQSHNRFDAV